MARKATRMADKDMISALPNEIIGRILSFLSTEEVVATSVLSSRWRYAYAFNSNLSFVLDNLDILRRTTILGSRHLVINSFLRFVDKVLYSNVSNIKQFKLTLWEDVGCSCVSGWIGVAITRGVEHLDVISINDDSVKKLLSGCLVLENLSIEFCDMKNINTFDISHAHMKSFNFQLNLDLENSNYWMVADTPMLAHFKYYALEAVGYSFGNL
ncbi:hypothetical protein PTKIN_Ptkin03bG0030100 [Pterospermum kingtungense]